MKIINIAETNMNEYYDPRNCHDGGGYYQPRIVIDFDDGIRVVINDTSCGDFGNRITCNVYMGAEMLYSAAWGDMLSMSEKGSDIPWSDRLQLIYDATKYDIMCAEEWVEICADYYEDDDEF